MPLPRFTLRPSNPVIQGSRSYFLSPSGLFLLRLILLLWHVSVFATAIISGVTQGYPDFIWFTLTHLAYTILVLYYAAAVGLSYRYSTLRTLPTAKAVENAKEKGEDALDGVTLVLYTFSINTHIAVTVIYWTLLSAVFEKNSPLGQYVAGAQHVGNLVSVLLSFVLERWIPTFWTSVVHICMLLLYVFWMWGYYAVTGIWVYFFAAFDAGPPGQVVGTYLGLVAGFVLLATVVLWAHRGKEWLVRRIWKQEREDENEEESGNRDIGAL